MRNYTRLFLSLALVGAASVVRAQPLARPCATATTLAEKRVMVIRSVFTSTDTLNGYKRFARAMGVDSLSPSAIVAETDSAVCTAVSDAIAAHFGAGLPASNYLVLRAGTRFIALDPSGQATMLFTVDSLYHDVRVSAP
jgi:hypothetical protein